ncbi:MAG: hypothetical protein HOW73_39690 [Polyangiaceae bacterium]|nr:hypothetical protein [Polyangiaceae bacterium]
MLLEERSTAPGRVAAVAVAIGCFAALAGACRGIVGSDSVDAVGELCVSLTDCYGEARFACDTLVGRANEAPDEVITSFLRDFDPEACLDSCSGSRVCLDNALFCTARTEACSFQDECCGWSEGLAECQERPGGAACCARDGVQCEETSDCCESECIDGFCGGTQCALVDEPCRWALDCCSGRCIVGLTGDKTCQALQCSKVGEPCKSSDECCKDPGGLEVLECVGATEASPGVCLVQTPCTAEGGPCVPGGDSACCEGTSCELATATKEFVCNPTDCDLAGFDCADDSDCCGSLICSFSVTGSFCDLPPNECGKAGVGCMEGADCCSGTCIAGACTQGGNGCESTIGTCHSPLAQGPVISSECEEHDECVAIVKAADAFCACTAWDSLCVGDYVACCGNVDGACN